MSGILTTVVVAGALGVTDFFISGVGGKISCVAAVSICSGIFTSLVFDILVFDNMKLATVTEHLRLHFHYL